MEVEDTNNEIELIETSKFIKQLHIDEHKDEDEAASSFPVVTDNKTVEENLSVGGAKKGLRKDLKTILLLMYLYFMQGLPLGLAGSIPFILASKKTSFSDQGTFSFVFWPFSIKLLWAPFVDSIFFKKFGRRKSWLVPIQLIIGILMLTLAHVAENVLGNIQSQRGLRTIHSTPLH